MADSKVTQEKRKQYDHTYKLVGQFMGIWSMLEGSVNEGVGKLLGLDTLEALIATANMQFRNKIHILKAVVHLRCGFSDWGKAAIKSLEEAGTLADNWRNIVAHNAFVPHGDGVKFLIVKARGKLDFPEVIRSEVDFLVVGKQMGKLAERIDEIVAAVAAMKAPTGMRAISDLWPMLMQPPQESANYLGRPLQAFLGFPPPTSEESPQTPKEPEGK